MAEYDVDNSVEIEDIIAFLVYDPIKGYEWNVM